MAFCGYDMIAPSLLRLGKIIRFGQIIVDS
jgi:hypothetical protein